MRKKLSRYLVFTFIASAIIACSNLSSNNRQSYNNSGIIFENYSIPRAGISNSSINYYLSKPETAESYPLVILVGGSTDKDHVETIYNFHKYFRNQLASNQLGAISVDGWGVNNDSINESEFIAHYTRTQILNNYQQVIDYIRLNPPAGWDGKLSVLGVSEGGPIAIQLNEQNVEIEATVIWSGALDGSWQDTLWLDMESVYNSICISLKNPPHDCYDIASKNKFDARIESTLRNPSPEVFFFNMSNLYVADGVKFPAPDYNRLHGNILVVTGVQDTIINSSDEFVRHAQEKSLNIEYWRVESMDHLIRNHPELIDNSFIWIGKNI